ncbi:hypothetical protein PN462_09570 [Spirulina sp. CS-785/01]|uniref:hypothetical protein n=1 Tax=Spirulina sp. CS-785/01 TaxID=3021716 RepID=UPI00232C7A71|nr:hypothetical protein [Spirulina sp. CS-785/01]MDB9313346.1 hypothetical protein [Spirulina sp. CS-785/01]
MNPLEQLSLEINQVNKQLQLNFESLPALQQQKQTLEQSYQILLEKTQETQLILQQLQAAHNKMMLAQGTKAVVGLATMLLFDGDGDDGGWFSGIIEEMINEIGEELFDQALAEFFQETLKDASGIQTLLQSYQTIEQQIESSIPKIQELIDLANFCLQNETICHCIEIQDTSEIQYSEKLTYLVSQIQLIFPFHQSPSLANQLSKNEQSIKEIEKIKIFFQKTIKELEQSDDNKITGSSIEMLFTLFSKRFKKLQYEPSGMILVYIDDTSQSFPDIKTQVKKLIDQYSFCLAQAQKLQTLFQNFPQDTKIKKLLRANLPARNIEAINEKVIKRVTQTTHHLELSKPEASLQKIKKLKTLKKQAQKIQTHLQSSIKRYKNCNQFPLSLESLASLLFLLGQSITQVGLNSEGKLTIYYQTETLELEQLLTILKEFQNQLHKALVQANSLIQLGESCLTNTKFLQIYKKSPAPLSFPEYQEQCEQLTDRIATCKFKDFQLKPLRVQVSHLKETVEQLQQSQQKLQQLTQRKDSQTGFILDIPTLKLFMSIFGRVTALGYDLEGNLILVQGGKKWVGKECLDQCDRLTQDLAPYLTTGQQKLAFGTRCLNDSQFRREQIRQQQQKKRLKQGAIAAGILITLSYTGITVERSLQTHETYTEIQATLSTLPPLDQLETLEALQSAQTQRQTAIQELKQIPNLPGSAYSQAQQTITTTQHQLQTLNNQLQQVEKAQKLIQDATQRTPNPPYPLDVWQEAEKQLTEALQLLKHIPSDTFSLTTISQQINQSEKQLATVQNQIKREQNAANAFQNTQTLFADIENQVDTFGELAADSITLQNQCQQLQQALNGIPKNTSIYKQNSRFIKDQIAYCTLLRTEPKLAVQR